MPAYLSRLVMLARACRELLQQALHRCPRHLPLGRVNPWVKAVLVWEQCLLCLRLHPFQGLGA